MNDEFPSSTTEPYFRLLRQRPDLFKNAPANGIDILTSPEEITAAQENARRTRQLRDMDVSDLRVGVLATDPYMLVVRDAVQFADGTLGLYNRIIEIKCAAMLPLLDGRPVVIRNLSSCFARLDLGISAWRMRSGGGI